jgi:4-hydroxy-4-methyl-2-oxoglutarate aldolase
MELHEILDILLNGGTAVIADVFDTLGKTPPVLNTKMFPIGGARFAGRAYTIGGEMHHGQVQGDRAKLAAIDAMPPGTVPIWAGKDIRGVCCFGDLLATAMKARGCAGVVVDGGVRDVAYLQKLGLPMWARYRTPAQAIGRWRVVSRQEPVKVLGALKKWVTVHPDDIIVADEDGVIIVPIGLGPEIAHKVQQWAAVETGAREEIRHGLPLLVALEKYGHL